MPVQWLGEDLMGTGLLANWLSRGELPTWGGAQGEISLFSAEIILQELTCQARDWTWKAQGTVSGGLLLGMHSQGLEQSANLSRAFGSQAPTVSWGNRGTELIIMMTAAMSGGLVGTSS